MPTIVQQNMSEIVSLIVKARRENDDAVAPDDDSNHRSEVKGLAMDTSPVEYTPVKSTSKRQRANVFASPVLSMDQLWSKAGWIGEPPSDGPSSDGIPLFDIISPPRTTSTTVTPPDAKVTLSYPLS